MAQNVNVRISTKLTKKRQMDRNCGEAAPPKEALASANVLCLLIRGQRGWGERPYGTKSKKRGRQHSNLWLPPVSPEPSSLRTQSRTETRKPSPEMTGISESLYAFA